MKFAHENMVLAILVAAWYSPALAADYSPVLLPVVTNDSFGIGAGRMLANIDAEYRLNLSATHTHRASADPYFIAEDIYTLKGVDEKASVSGQGGGFRLAWNGAESGYGFIDACRVGISGDYGRAGERTNLDVDVNDQSGYLRVPVRKSISLGVIGTGRSYSGRGHCTELCGVIGDAISPFCMVESDRRSLLLFASLESRRGGVLLGLGREDMQSAYTLVDTDRLTVPVDRDGGTNAAAWWLNTGGGRLYLAYSASDQRGSAPVLYNNSRSGRSDTSFSSSQWCLQYSGERWGFWAGINDTQTAIDAFGVRPTSNSLTVIAKGALSVDSVYGGGRYNLHHDKTTNVNLSYTLHRIDIKGDGLYRSGYLGGLIEFERLSGMLDERWYTNVLSLDASCEFGRIKLGYSGTVCVPIRAKHGRNEDTPASPRKSMGGGLTHVFSVSCPF